MPESKIDEIRNAAKTCSKAMGLGYTGIDIILNDRHDRLYFLEAHSFPAYERGFNLMKFLMEKV